MRRYPKNDYDYEDLKEYNYEDWQLEALKMNPEYVWWGNGEDYMWVNGDGWNSPCELESIEGLWELDELNELINFYFELTGHSESKTKLALQMWFIHPRKGASRGVYLKEIKNIKELNKVVDYLIQARERNYDRFSKLTAIGKLL